MSGGSLDYLYHSVEEGARLVEKEAKTPLHKAFAKHLVKVAKALYELEWMLSDDTSPGDEEKAIREVVTPSEEIESATEDAFKVLNDLKRVLGIK